MDICKECGKEVDVILDIEGWCDDCCNRLDKILAEEELRERWQNDL